MVKVGRGVSFTIGGWQPKISDVDLMLGKEGWH